MRCEKSTEMAKVDHVYVRVSGDTQTLDQQREAVLASLPATVVNPTIHEETMSGSRDDRPVYQKLRKEIAGGKVGSLTVWSLDRLGRNNREVQAFVWMCRDAGVTLRCVKEKIDFDGPFASVIVAMIATFAEMELTRIKERTKAKFDHYRAVSGWKMHGSPPADDILAEKVLKKVKAIWALHDAGQSLRQIHDALGVSVKVVQKVLRGGREKVWYTRSEWCRAHPDWYRTPQDYGCPPSKRSEERQRIRSQARS